MIITIDKRLSTINNQNIEKNLKIIEDFFKCNGLDIIKLKEIENYIYFDVIGDTFKIDEQSVLALPMVINCNRIEASYKLCSRAYQNNDTVIDVNGIMIGGQNPVFIAGPCSVESKEQIEEIAKGCKESGAEILRGGAYKPRTSPYYFQGLGENGINLLKNAGKKNNMPIISEIISVEDLPMFIEKVDIIQVGARSMQNFELLKALGKIDKPILLKRGAGNTIEEWLMSAEYILAGGNKKVILCERGIKTFEKATRYTLDLSSIAIVHKLSHLPVIVDPSHAMGNYNFVAQMTLAAIASGANGVMIEVHNDPKKALSDGNQALKLNKLKDLIRKARKIAEIIKDE